MVSRPASLVRVFDPHASASMRSQGVEYYQDGRVESVDLLPDGTVEATVRGRRRHEVTLGRDRRSIWADCDCTAFARAGLCKHVLAVAHATDQGGHSATLLGFDPAGSRPSPLQARPAWELRLARLSARARRDRQAAPEPQAVYEIRLERRRCLEVGGLVLGLMRRRVLKKGGLAAPQTARWSSLPTAQGVPEALRDALLRVAAHGDSYARPWRWDDSHLVVKPHAAATALARACATGTVRAVREDGTTAGPMSWSEVPWSFELRLRPGGESGGGGMVLEGVLARGAEVRPIEASLLLLSDAIVAFDEDAAPLADHGAFDWVAALRNEGPLVARAEEAGAFLARVLEATAGLPLDLGAFAVPGGLPEPSLDLSLGEGGEAAARIRFSYGGAVVPSSAPNRHFVASVEPLRVLTRDLDAEKALLDAFAAEGGVRRRPDGADRPYGFPLEDLAERLGRLVEAGWHVCFEDRPLRRGGCFSLRVRSGIDWFDLGGEARFDEAALALPRILEAVAEGRRVVTLDDGGAALIPEEWMRRLGALGALAGGKGARVGEVRVARARGLLLDALLGDVERAVGGEVHADAAFDRLRGALARFRGIVPLDEPAAFQGTLRPYQREALGWLAFLEEMGLGGCLADDMGLGKTIQVLAWLLRRREVAREAAAPRSRRARSASADARPGAPRTVTLVVAPRSVMSNWIHEARRFAPSLRTATYHGPGREGLLERLGELDLVVTTYATMRADLPLLEAVPFDAVILDEAQAIKNPESRTARAACRIDASVRLALSGTPIENHLHELGSLFAFLAPGLLGSRDEFRRLLEAGRAAEAPAPERLAWLQRAIRPVVLRRTREQVLDELPPKGEHLLRCPLEPAQRAAYDAIRAHYRASVLARVAKTGLARARLHVLEALLRLRQAACHPALIDPSRRAEPSAKLDQLVPMLSEIAQAGHKALVFSQFTSFLALVRAALDRAGIRYEYLDGRTRKRREPIDRFQTDPSVSAFLISLKAGGTGLNLTAAEYVFLLDPWWNPAVEAQAVGRAHRMGQARPVTVYRLIGEDTVEDRVLELQARKRALVEAVLGGVANAPLAGITREDLDILLG
jgi:superfamily II DNA or RNA helicase